jgi:hypothetical protein
MKTQLQLSLVLLFFSSSSSTPDDSPRYRPESNGRFVPIEIPAALPGAGRSHANGQREET